MYNRVALLVHILVDLLMHIVRQLCLVMVFHRIAIQRLLSCNRAALFSPHGGLSTINWSFFVLLNMFFLLILFHMFVPTVNNCCMEVLTYRLSYGMPAEAEAEVGL